MSQWHLLSHLNTTRCSVRTGRDECVIESRVDVTPSLCGRNHPGDFSRVMTSDGRRGCGGRCSRRGCSRACLASPPSATPARTTGYFLSRIFISSTGHFLFSEKRNNHHCFLEGYIIRVFTLQENRLFPRQELLFPLGVSLGCRVSDFGRSMLPGGVQQENAFWRRENIKGFEDFT